jgi:fructan beta-fructosidase
MNPGGPNSGSATQYIVGDFDGHTFKPFTSTIKWMDYGPDNYAGVSFSNAGERKILIGWMSNWNYANVVPTEKWRSAMTVPRELNLLKRTTNSNEFLLVSSPVKELNAGFTKMLSKENILIEKIFSLTSGVNAIPNRIDLATLQTKDFEIVFSNDHNEKLIVGHDATKKQFFIDRRNAGISNFHEGFAAVTYAPRLIEDVGMDLSLLIDKTSVELFADGGRTVMTALFFPTHPYTNCIMQTKEGMNLKSINLFSLK